MPYVYEIKNLIDNKKYIGFCSKTPNNSLNYYGSGKLINRMINKYGKENFQKTILKEFNNERDARLYEEYLNFYITLLLIMKFYHLYIQSNH